MLAWVINAEKKQYYSIKDNLKIPRNVNKNKNTLKMNEEVFINCS